jgi:hypothetical protein
LRKLRSGTADEIGWEFSDWIPFDIGTWADAETVVVVLVALVLAVFVLIPVLLFGVELIIVGCLLAASIVSRILRRGPWVVEAERLGGGEILSWTVPGWRRSHRAMKEIAHALAAGSRPDPHEADSLR